MKRVATGISVIVVALTLLGPPASAQNGSAWLTPKSPTPSESAGGVVLTVSMWRAGRVVYQTMDGACQVGFSRGATPPEAVCSGDMARAPEDYTATSGELIFTQGGDKTITIPIIDDDVTDGDETFTLAAWEEVNADPWIDRGDSVIVRILDNESSEIGGELTDPAQVSTTDTTAAGRTSGSERTPAPTTTSGPGVVVDPATSATAVPDSRDLEVALPAGDLRPGPGFELTADGPPRSAPPNGRAGGGSTGWLAIGSGTAALSVGALAMVHRRRRWSPTQP